MRRLNIVESRRDGMQRRESIQAARSGEPCEKPSCSGVLTVYHSHVDLEESVRVRYLRCSVCRHLPDANKQIVPLQFAPPR